MSETVKYLIIVHIAVYITLALLRQRLTHLYYIPTGYIISTTVENATILLAFVPAHSREPCPNLTASSTSPPVNNANPAPLSAHYKGKQACQRPPADLPKRLHRMRFSPSLGRITGVFEMTFSTLNHHCDRIPIFRISQLQSNSTSLHSINIILRSIHRFVVCIGLFESGLTALNSNM